MHTMFAQTYSLKRIVRSNVLSHTEHLQSQNNEINKDKNKNHYKQWE